MYLIQMCMALFGICLHSKKQWHHHHRQFCLTKLMFQFTVAITSAWCSMTWSPSAHPFLEEFCNYTRRDIYVACRSRSGTQRSLYTSGKAKSQGTWITVRSTFEPCRQLGYESNNGGAALYIWMAKRLCGSPNYAVYYDRFSSKHYITVMMWKLERYCTCDQEICVNW